MATPWQDIIGTTAKGLKDDKWFNSYITFYEMHKDGKEGEQRVKNVDPVRQLPAEFEKRYVCCIPHGLIANQLALPIPVWHPKEPLTDESLVAVLMPSFNYLILTVKELGTVTNPSWWGMYMYTIFIQNTNK